MLSKLVEISKGKQLSVVSPPATAHHQNSNSFFTEYSKRPFSQIPGSGDDVLKPRSLNFVNRKRANERIQQEN